jgi:hypothetical protein
MAEQHGRGETDVDSAAGARAGAGPATNRALTEAIALYRSAGYREVPPFNTEPYAHHWFEKTLRA